MDYCLKFRLSQKLHGIKARCRKPSNPGYRHYGGRGIDIAPDLESLADFLDYMVTLPGHDDPALSLDRIDNNKGYEKGNLRFATKAVQMQNRRKAPKQVEVGTTLSGFTVLDGKKQHKDGLKLECKCATCGNLQWQLRGKLIAGTPKKCLPCFNEEQTRQAKASRG